MEKGSNSDGLCGEPAGEELRFVEAGGPVRKLKAEFAWLDSLFMGSELGAERGNNSVMRMTFEKGNSDRVMDRTTAVPKKHKFGENRQVHVLTREQASPQRCKLDLLYCQEIFVKPFVAVPHTLLLLAHLVMKLDCYLPFMVLIKNQIYMPELTVAALLITHKCN